MLIIERRDLSARSPVLHGGFGRRAPLIRPTVSAARPLAPPQPQPASQALMPRNSAATRDAPVAGAWIPPCLPSLLSGFAAPTHLPVASASPAPKSEKSGPPQLLLPKSPSAGGLPAAAAG